MPVSDRAAGQFYCGEAQQSGQISSRGTVLAQGVPNRASHAITACASTPAH